MTLFSIGTTVNLPLPHPVYTLPYITVRCIAVYRVVQITSVITLYAVSYTQGYSEMSGYDAQTTAIKGIVLFAAGRSCLQFVENAPRAKPRETRSITHRRCWCFFKSNTPGRHCSDSQ